MAVAAVAALDPGRSGCLLIPYRRRRSVSRARRRTRVNSRRPAAAAAAGGLGKGEVDSAADV